MEAIIRKVLIFLIKECRQTIFNNSHEKYLQQER